MVRAPFNVFLYGFMKVFDGLLRVFPTFSLFFHGFRGCFSQEMPETRLVDAKAG